MFKNFCFASDMIKAKKNWYHLTEAKYIIIVMKAQS